MLKFDLFPFAVTLKIRLRSSELNQESKLCGCTRFKLTHNQICQITSDDPMFECTEKLFFFLVKTKFMTSSKGQYELMKEHSLFVLILGHFVIL